MCIPLTQCTEPIQHHPQVVVRFGKICGHFDRRLEMLFRRCPLLLLIGLNPLIVVTNRGGTRARR